MIKRNLLALIISFVCVLTITQTTQAATKGAYIECDTSDTCPDGYSCQLGRPDANDPDYTINLCQPDSSQGIFGKIKPPDSLKTFIGNDASGAGGLSQFFSNLIALFYSIAAITLVLMLVWGAWDWLTSEGEKEKVQSAQKKIVNAIIGIILFAVAFAVIQVLGNFTGFTFFVGQI